MVGPERFELEAFVGVSEAGARSRNPERSEGSGNCMVRPERFELPTYSSGGCRSIQLSYGRTPFSVYMRSFTLSIGGSKVIATLQAARAEP
jgi:hypothetical protein